MSELDALDDLFHAAVAALDAGDVAALQRLIDANPRLVSDRLEKPGAWLRDHTIRRDRVAAAGAKRPARVSRRAGSGLD